MTLWTRFALYLNARLNLALGHLQAWSVRWLPQPRPALRLVPVRTEPAARRGGVPRLPLR